MPGKNKLDDAEINRLRAIVDMDKSSSPKDDVDRLAEALERLEGEKKRLEELKKKVVTATISKPGEQEEVKPVSEKEEREERKEKDESGLKEGAKKLVERIKESGRVVEVPVAKLKIGEVKKTDKDLFVKIDEHREIAEQLIIARNAIRDVAETIELLAKAESIKEEAIRRLEESLDKIDHAWKKALELLEEGDKTYPEYYDERSTIKSDDYYQLKVELERLRKILEKIK